MFVNVLVENMSHSHRGLSALLFSALLLSFLLLSFLLLSFLDGRSRLEVDRDVASRFLLALARVDSLDREIALMVER